jgi:hypothetical protein
VFTSGGCRVALPWFVQMLFIETHEHSGPVKKVALNIHKFNSISFEQAMRQPIFPLYRLIPPLYGE